MLWQCGVVFMLLSRVSHSVIKAQVDFLEELQQDINSKNIPNGKLVQVSIVTRHGQRTPKDPYPNDPYRDVKYWPEGWLQLTAVGAEQHRELGRFLRRNYNDTIPETFTSNSVYIRSTGISRTLASAFALTSALFPNQAIPIHSAPSQYDKLFSPHKSCPAFDEEMNKYLSSPQVVEEERLRKPFYKWTKEHTGRPFNGVDAAEGLYSLLTIEKQRGYHLPEWTNSAYPQPLRNLTAVFLARSSATRKLARLRYGSLLKDIFMHAERAGKKTQKKFLMYSAHDFTVIGLLNCLEVFDGQPSGFASSITFEVRYGDSPLGNTVNMFYRNESNAPPVKLLVKGCGHPCYIKNLKKVVSDIIPEDIEKECLGEDLVVATNSQGNFVTMTFILSMSYLIFVVVSIIAVCWSKLSPQYGLDTPMKGKSEYILI